MKKCKACGFNNMDKAVRCLKCQAVLDTRADQMDGLPAPERWRPRLPAILPGARRAMRVLGRKMFVAPLPEDLPHRQPFIAGMMSFAVPGAGQIYNHRWKKAGWVVAAWIVFAIVAFATLRWGAGIEFTIRRNWLRLDWMMYFSNAILFLWGMFILWSANDAVVDACRINGQKWTSRNSWALFFAEVFTVGLLAMVLQISGSPLVKFLSVRQAGFEPVIGRQDRVIVETMSYIFRVPRRGEVVLYNPGTFKIEKPGAIMSDAWIIDERRSFERIVGLPGDVVERRDGRLFVNDQALPLEFWPLGDEFPKSEFRLVAPPDHYILIFSHMPTDALVGLMGAAGMSSAQQAPRLDSGLPVYGWEEVCIVPVKAIEGRAVAVYHVPPNRRWLKPPADPLAE